MGALATCGPMELLTSRRAAEAGDPVPERMQLLQVPHSVELLSQGPLARAMPLGEESSPPLKLPISSLPGWFSKDSGIR